MIRSKGYTLVELIVAVGLFAIVMMIASGAYLIMISANRTAQGITTGINNLSYALESMTRNIRTGTGYECPTLTDFYFTDQTDRFIQYGLNVDGTGPKIQESIDYGPFTDLTDQSVEITSLGFTCSAIPTGGVGVNYVTITVSGSVSTGPGKTQSFTIETGAARRKINL